MSFKTLSDCSLRVPSAYCSAYYSAYYSALLLRLIFRLILLLPFLFLAALTLTSNTSFADTDISPNSRRVANLKEIRGKDIVDQSDVAVHQLSQSALNSTPIIVPKLTMPKRNNITDSQSPTAHNWQPPKLPNTLDARELATYGAQFDNTTDSQLVLAYLHIEQGHYNTALKILKEASVLEPYDSRIQFLSGIAYLLSGSYYSAITSLNRSLKLQEEALTQPNTANTANTANTLFDAPIAPCTYYGLAMAQTLAGRHSQAYNTTTGLINSYKTATTTATTTATANLPLLTPQKTGMTCFYNLQKQVLNLIPNGGLSDASLRKVHPLDTNMQLAILYYLRAVILSNAKYFNDAVEDDKQAIKLVPNEVAFQNHLAYNYMEAKEFRKAVEQQLSIIATFGGSAYSYNALSLAYTLYGALESDNHLFYQQKAKEASYNACYFYQDCTMYNSINNGDVFVEQLY